MNNNSVLSMASHRLLSLEGDDVAILADRSTGWCIVNTMEYDTISKYLSESKQTLEGTDIKSQKIIKSLWEAGVLYADGKPHPDTVLVQNPYPNALLLKLTGACNFECSYCYDYDAKRFKARLNFERIKEIISFLLSKQSSLSIAFHGGEPLLRFDLIKEVVNFAIREAGSVSRIGFSIQTNGSLFNEEVVSFLDKYNFSVGISLDGANEESNALRVVNRGRTPWKSVQELLKRYPTFVKERCGFLAVASRTSARHIPDFALWLQDKGVGGLSISFLDLVGRGETLYDEMLTPNEAVDLYKELFRMIRQRQIEKLAIKSIIGRMNNLFTFQPRDFCYKGACGASGDFLVVDAEGSLRSCDCIYDSFFVLGSSKSQVPENSKHPARLAVSKRNEWLRENSSNCSTCAVFGLCGGTCVAKAISNHKTPQSVDPVECALSLYLYPELLQEFATGNNMPLFDYYNIHRHSTKEWRAS
ncbi:radical SAM protein [Bacillus sp. DX1.1]|uniref:radical SAM/SPASM domain-containing protein n=1 Tax=unclassified Bacillus (in: firmicutes) TaxID=185979 RepID=UPI0025708632|nr:MULTISPECIES: radical SAM protein [unclassified Bacillus (in: firmicutes)]MDM5153335.1 radical SAM protein [Bacillus sp. DX1.1]WJE82293.1 radical SAM protein [Bacillus sp. DX3.1]